MYYMLPFLLLIDKEQLKYLWLLSRNKIVCLRIILVR